MNTTLRHRIVWIGVIGLLGLGVAGCGVTGHLATTPAGSSTAGTSGSTRPSSSTTSSAPSSINSPPPSASSVTTASAPTSTSPASTSPVSTTTTAAASSSYTAVVTQALQWLQARTHQPLGAPTWIPSASMASGQYISPTTNLSAQGWAILLHLTHHPYGVNNPAINQSPDTQIWVSWGLNVMTTGQLATNRLGLLEAYSQMGPSHPPVTQGTPQPVSLGTGINGSLYGNGTVVWHEGDWTLIVQGTGTNGTSDVAEAKTLVAYLHTAYLPPYSGLVDVLQNTASVDWLQGSSLFSMMGGQEPALDVLHMAVSWRPLSSGRAH